ncbi:hypothetical protein N7462_001781 [Penicillium macrosclerotiorum]|uniref:uncharacterized protein n=1 Tax=Penicillium macrosclerotiorum TaxID=303699 RepID=UPI00254874DA|nr:uncharacterized protein N7462_001781 [Penicillium macrosclerotiorum]KAJ5692358.1 hypothetical protein N7462_001781 [Penicillium macrosclerotiorum]
MHGHELDVVSKLRSWCSAASVSISSNQTTPSNCSSYDYPTSTPLSFDSEDNSGGLSATAKAGIIVGVVGGISCLVIVFLSCRRVTHKEEPIQNFPLQYMQPGPRIALPPNVYMPPERVATPPPPYSAEAPEVADDKEAPLGNAFSTDSASEPSSPETSPRRVSS